jgi:4-amino-4-deoxy-L-arabinose transferase-like glycosyltransferase
MGGNAKSDATSRFLSFCALLVAAFMLFASLGRLSLMEPDEERNAEVAREMKQSGAWLIPTYNGLPYLDKPAFHFKTVALSFAMFGESNAAARLPSALSGFALLVLLFGFCRRVYSERCAALAVFVVATSPLYIAFSRLVIFDMTLAFFVCASIFAGFLAEEDEPRRSRWYLLGAASAGFATLVKGPVGFILPVLVLCIFNWLDGRRGALKRFFAPVNVVVFFAIVLPWFLGVTHLYPDFAWYGIVEESFRRYTTTTFHRTGPIYYYVPWIVAGCFAWSVLLPGSIIAAWKARTQWSRADRLFVVWSILLFVFFSVSQSKRPNYILTVVAALGALTARVFDRAFARGNGRAARLVLHGAVMLAVVSAVGAGLLAMSIIKPGTMERLLQIRSEESTWLPPVYAPVMGGLVLIALTAVLARWLGNLRVAFAAFLLLPLVVLTVGFRGLTLYADAKSFRTLASTIPELSSNTKVVCLQCFPTGLPFYLKRFVTVVSDSGKEFTSNYVIFMLSKVKPWPENVVPLAERDRWLTARDHPVYLIARKNAREALESIAATRGVAVTELEPGWWGALLPAASR